MQFSHYAHKCNKKSVALFISIILDVDLEIYAKTVVFCKQDIDLYSFLKRSQITRFRLPPHCS